MTKLLEEQLAKLNLSILNPNQPVLIKQGELLGQGLSASFQLFHKYEIKVSDYIIHPYETFTLHDNFNNGIIPKDNIMHIQVDKISSKGNMIFVNAIGQLTGDVWIGWLPIKSCEILKELE